MSLWHLAHVLSQCCSWLWSLVLEIVILTVIVFISMLLLVVVDCQLYVLHLWRLHKHPRGGKSIGMIELSPNHHS